LNSPFRHHLRDNLGSRNATAYSGYVLSHHLLKFRKNCILNNFLIVERLEKLYETLSKKMTCIAGTFTGFTAVFTVSIWLLFGSGLAWGNAADQKQLVDNAKHTIESFMDDPQLTWFQDHVKDAKALLIVPQLLKGAFIFGAEGGSGVLIVRDKDSNNWSHPAFYVLGGLSFEFQWGGKPRKSSLWPGQTALLKTYIPPPLNWVVMPRLRRAPMEQGLKDRPQ